MSNNFNILHREDKSAIGQVTQKVKRRKNLARGHQVINVKTAEWLYSYIRILPEVLIYVY